MVSLYYRFSTNSLEDFVKLHVSKSDFAFLPKNEDNPAYEVSNATFSVLDCNKTHYYTVNSTLN